MTDYDPSGDAAIGMVRRLEARIADLEARLVALENYTGFRITNWREGERHRYVGSTKVYRTYADFVDD